MSTLSHWAEKIWENVQDIIHGRGKAYLVFHRVIDLLNLFAPSFTSLVTDLVEQAASLEHMSGSEKRDWVFEHTAAKFPQVSKSKVYLAIEAACQLLPEKLEDWK